MKYMEVDVHDQLLGGTKQIAVTNLTDLASKIGANIYGCFENPISNDPLNSYIVVFAKSFSDPNQTNQYICIVSWCYTDQDIDFDKH